MKGIQIRNEEVKLSLFADDMILYTENPKDAIRKPLEFINEFSKAASIKLIHRNLHFYERPERETKETIPFTIPSKRIQYLGLNPPKETKKLYSEKLQDTDERNQK